MNGISTWMSRWWGRSSPAPARCSTHVFAFRLKADATLMSPDLPGTRLTAADVKRMRESNGFEPATRTLVRSNSAGHSVMVLLLKNH